MASPEAMASAKSRNSDHAGSSWPAGSRRQIGSSGVYTSSPSTSMIDIPDCKLNPSFTLASKATSGILRPKYQDLASETSDFPVNKAFLDALSPAPSAEISTRTMEDIWKGVTMGGREMKAEPVLDSDVMTLEDFLMRAGTESEQSDAIGGCEAVQMLDQMDGAIVGFRSGREPTREGRGKRERADAIAEAFDRAAYQKHKRMIKNRESAARSRERKQAYQAELETQVLKLEEENRSLRGEKELRTMQLQKHLMKNIIPVVESRPPRRTLRRTRSMNL